MNIISSYPVGLLMLCALAGCFFSFFLYYWKPSKVLSRWQRFFLAVLRFLTIFLISSLLLSLAFRLERRRSEKPIVLFLQDNSESLAEERQLPDWNALRRQLSGPYTVEMAYFGDGLLEVDSADFSAKQTNFSRTFAEIAQRYLGRNLAAVVMASDGIYTAGEHPVNAVEQLPCPIYTLALGDTTEYRDVKVARLQYNRFAYLGNDFRLEVDLQALHAKGQEMDLVVSQHGKTVFAQKIPVTSANFFLSIPLTLTAEQLGVQSYELSLRSLAGEKNTRNNRQTAHVEVIDNRRKIGLMASAPHPDLSALRQALTASDRYDVEVKIGQPLSQKLTAYDLLILHQIPSQGRNYAALFSELEKAGLPLWFIVGQQSDLGAFNALERGLRIQPRSAAWNEVTPFWQSDFSAFRFSSAWEEKGRGMPAVLSPFAQYTMDGKMQLLASQRVLGVAMPDPLWAFLQSAGRRTAFFVGDGLWRWRLFDYLQNQNHELFDEAVSATVQYLSAAADKRPFRVHIPALLEEGEALVVDAELYNESFEAVNQAEVTMVIIDSLNQQYPFRFSAVGDGYRLQAGYLPPGDYRYEATAQQGQLHHSLSGHFTVGGKAIESLDKIAKPHLLAALSEKSGARLFMPSQMEALADSLQQNEWVKPVTYIEKKYYTWNHLPFLLLSLLLLLSAEWLLRKYWGLS